MQKEERFRSSFYVYKGRRPPGKTPARARLRPQVQNAGKLRSYLLFFIAKASSVTAMPPSEVQRSSPGIIRPVAQTAFTVPSMPTEL